VWVSLYHNVSMAHAVSKTEHIEALYAVYKWGVMLVMISSGLRIGI